MEALKALWARAEAFAKAHRLPVGAGLVCLLLGLALGHFGTPAKVRVETKTVEVTKTQTVQVVKEVEVEARQQKQALVFHVERTRVRQPSGAVEEKTVVDAHQEKDSESTRQEAKEARQVQTVEVTRTVEKVTQVPAKLPRWQIAAMAGLQLSFVQPVFGGRVEYRVVGPLWLGAWGLSSPAVGVSLGLAW